MGFAPAILWRLCRYARDADFITLHSLYSFPVLAAKPAGSAPIVNHMVVAAGVLLASSAGASVSVRKRFTTGLLLGVFSVSFRAFFRCAGEREEAYKLGLTPPSGCLSHMGLMSRV